MSSEEAYKLETETAAIRARAAAPTSYDAPGDGIEQPGIEAEADSYPREFTTWLMSRGVSESAYRAMDDDIREDIECAWNENELAITQEEANADE
jgi:hypothetical protein